MSGVVTQNISGNSGLVKAVEAGGGTWVEIKTLTSDGSDATMSFVNGTSDVVLDSTYPIYCFKFINIHPASAALLTFNGSVDTGSNYNVTKTTTHWRVYHNEAGDDVALTYDAGSDLAQGTGFQDLGHAIKTDNDASGAGFLYLFSPASTTFVKHFIAQFTVLQNSDYNMNSYITGYLNNTSAVDAIRFAMNTGNIDAGKIKLFGIKDS